MFQRFSEWAQLREDFPDINTNASQAGQAVKGDMMQAGNQGAAGLQLVTQVLMLVAQNNPGALGRVVSVLQSGVNACQIDDGQKKQVLGQLAGLKRQLTSMQGKNLGTNPQQQQAAQIAQQNGIDSQQGTPQMPAGGMTQPIVGNTS